MIVISLKDSNIKSLFYEGDHSFIYRLDIDKISSLLINERYFDRDLGLEICCIYENNGEKLFAIDLKREIYNSDRELTESVIHNLNNIITSIHTNSYILQSRDDKLAKESIFKASESAVKLSRKYISYSMLKKKGSAQLINLEDIVYDCLDIFNHKLEKLNIKIDTLFDEKVKIFINPSAVYQIFTSLILNSIDALKGVKDPSIEIRSYRDLEYNIISFTDNGSGISSENLDRVTMPGFTTKVGGTGYGLYHVSDFMKRNSGKLEIESSIKNKKTVVRLFFP
ncbi:MAG: hypothetical protein CSA15_03275 [Candidatus Delongbacteria bacterium]|nr:MAG: hypothetical protein CSA15_03275 [Candidatus Delongbacteria bacterium]